MCGFVGIADLTGHLTADVAARVDAMGARIAHRGPDDRTVLDVPFCRIEFRRLAIIDPAGGRQPVASPDGRIACVLNGELYDHRDHRAALARYGVPVPPGSDAAILPALYERHGPDFVHQLDGMFAIAVVDHGRRQVHLLRDALGIKPLYVARRGDLVLFASELTALVASGLVSDGLDPQAAAELAAFRFTLGPRTALDGVERVAPGERLVIDVARRRVDRTRWWTPESAAAEARRRRDGGTTRDLGAIIDRSVARQLVADVPVGLSLSGGLDSSLVAESVARTVRSTGGPVPTAYTTVFDDEDGEERAHARLVCRTLGLVQHEVPVTAADLEHDLDALVAAGDEPCLDPALLPAVAVARAASLDVKVLLSGTGGDELFGGYGHYRPGRQHSLLGALPPRVAPSVLRRLATRRGHLDPRRLDRLAAFAAMGPRGRRRLALQIAGRATADGSALAALLGPARDRALAAFTATWPEALAACAPHDPVAAPMRHDLAHYLPDQLLLLLDRATMASSIEGRVPLLGREVVEAGLALASHECFGPRIGLKHPLRTLAAHRLPAPLVAAPKRGWHTPVDRRLVDAGPNGRLDLARAILLDRASELDAFADAAAVRRLLEAGDDTARRRAAGTVHALVMLVRWRSRVRAIAGAARASFARRSAPVVVTPPTSGTAGGRRAA